MGQFIELIAADGFRLSAYRADPSGPARGGIVVAQEIFGVNRHIRASATASPPTATSRSRRRSSTGTSAGRPRLQPRPTSRGPRVEGARGARSGARRHRGRARCRDGRAGKVAVIGYCWGGYLAWMAAARLDGLRLRDRVLRRRDDSTRSDVSAALSGDGAFRRARHRHSRSPGCTSSGRASGREDVPLRGRPRVQLRRRGPSYDAAAATHGARAHAGIPAAARRLSPLGAARGIPARVEAPRRSFSAGRPRAAFPRGGCARPACRAPR